MAFLELLLTIYLVVEGLWCKLFVHNRQISRQTVHHFFKFLLLFVFWKERISEFNEINPFAPTANCDSINMVLYQQFETTVVPFKNVNHVSFLQNVTIQVKAIEQYFHVVLFIMLYKVVLTFKSVDETLVCDHSNESY